MEQVQLPSRGDLFLDRWRIEGEVGRGGFSLVYRAVDEAGRFAAIKILLPQPDAAGLTSYDGEIADRFLREARLLEQLDSPYTIRLWEHGQSPQGLFYMVFEFISGRSLFDEIRDDGALHPDRVIHILRQMLIGLQSAHKLGILHRDIKPNNVMLFERDGDPDRVKLLDFGIAKMFGEKELEPGMDLTAAGLLVGTPRYMSPEQLRNGTLGPPSDLYGIGLCAIEMLTGRKCIPGRDRIQIVQAQLHPQSFQIPPDVACPPGLREVVHRLTEKNLHARYRSAAEAVRDLEQLAGDPGATGDTVFQVVPAALGAPAAAPAENPDEDTVMHRLSASDLDTLAQEGRTILTTVDAAALEEAARTDRPPEEEPTVTATVPDLDFATGPTAAHPAVPFVPDPPTPVQPQRTSLMAGESVEQTIVPPSPGPASKLEQTELLALGASFLVPGLGHLMLGQLKKGIVILVLLAITVGLSWFLLAPAAMADAFLVIRARKRRAVGELEIFPDYQQLL